MTGVINEIGVAARGIEQDTPLPRVNFRMWSQQVDRTIRPNTMYIVL
jgi:hypothetical protein